MHRQRPGQLERHLSAHERRRGRVRGVPLRHGLDGPLDAVLEMRAAAREDGRAIGIKADGEVGEVPGVWHPRSVIEEGLESSVETAMSMLRIDQVISARGD